MPSCSSPFVSVAGMLLGEGALTHHVTLEWMLMAVWAALGSAFQQVDRTRLSDPGRAPLRRILRRNSGIAAVRHAEIVE